MDNDNEAPKKGTGMRTKMTATMIVASLLALCAVGFLLDSRTDMVTLNVRAEMPNNTGEFDSVEGITLRCLAPGVGMEYASNPSYWTVYTFDHDGDSVSLPAGTKLVGVRAYVWLSENLGGPISMEGESSSLAQTNSRCNFTWEHSAATVASNTVSAATTFTATERPDMSMAWYNDISWIVSETPILTFESGTYDLTATLEGLY